MNTPVIRILVVVCIVGLVGLNCEESSGPNHAPTITAVNLPDSVEIGNDATFSCTASDPDGDALFYTWTCSSGLLLSTTSSTVGWTAPDSSGAATITVVVRDSFGASDTSNGTVTVNPIVATIIEWDSTVAGLGSRVWHQFVPAGYTVSGSFSAGGQFITFLVLDEANYQEWDFRRPYTGLVKVDSSAGSSFSAVIPSTALYRFILDNRDNDSAVTAVHLTVQSTSP